MLTQLPSGDWIELESIVQVTATEMTPGEWAVIGHTPGGHWITLVPRPENKLLTKAEAERLRDVWAGNANEAKIAAVKAEATERLAALQRWRSDRQAKEQAAEVPTRHPVKSHTYRMDIETKECTLVDTLIDPQPPKEDTTPDQQPPLPVRKIQMERRPYPFTVGDQEVTPNCPTCQVPLTSVASNIDGMRFGGCDTCESTYFFKGSTFYSRDAVTAEFTPVNPHPSSAEYHKSRNQPHPDHDPVYHCPRCGHEAPRSQWSVVGIGVLPDGGDVRRCATCWNSGHSVIPNEGHRPVTGVSKNQPPFGRPLTPEENQLIRETFEENNRHPNRGLIATSADHRDTSKPPPADDDPGISPEAMAQITELWDKTESAPEGYEGPETEEEARETWRDRAINDPLL